MIYFPKLADVAYYSQVLYFTNACWHDDFPFEVILMTPFWRNLLLTWHDVVKDLFREAWYLAKFFATNSLRWRHPHENLLVTWHVFLSEIFAKLADVLLTSSSRNCLLTSSSQKLVADMVWHFRERFISRHHPREKLLTSSSWNLLTSSSQTYLLTSSSWKLVVEVAQHFVKLFYETCWRHTRVSWLLMSSSWNLSLTSSLGNVACQWAFSRGAYLTRRLAKLSQNPGFSENTFFFF